MESVSLILLSEHVLPGLHAQPNSWASPFQLSLASANLCAAIFSASQGVLASEIPARAATADGLRW